MKIYFNERFLLKVIGSDFWFIVIQGDQLTKRCSQWVARRELAVGWCSEAGWSILNSNDAKWVLSHPTDASHRTIFILFRSVCLVGCVVGTFNPHNSIIQYLELVALRQRFYATLIWCALCSSDFDSFAPASNINIYSRSSFASSPEECQLSENRIGDCMELGADISIRKWMELFAATLTSNRAKMTLRKVFMS